MLMPGRQEMLARTLESGPTRIYILDVFLGYLSIILGVFFVWTPIWEQIRGETRCLGFDFERRRKD